MRACLQELLKRLQEKHGKYAEALTQKTSSQTYVKSDSHVVTTVHTPYVMQVMMLFHQAKKQAQATQDRAKAAQDQAKTSEKDNDAAQKEL
jgi:beta-lactamase regulating signal transducer with metallopeptidase domain